ncbi:MAG: FAD-binding domain-containing protein [Alphaproteobacteria bacterium]
MEVNHSVAKNLLNRFIENGLPLYSKDRNFDFGTNKRGNVSNLSPYIRRRIIHEKEVISSCLENYNYQRIEKFIQEIFWRTYWKGWLEGRPKVWDDYLTELKKIEDNLNNLNFFKDYNKAINAQTGINCFDSWVKELKEYGYLHNHTRMWFASIWIFTLNLPWELGANFFYRNLLDADEASNTLSWRWVAGLHTSGKFYLARQDNIEKYSSYKFSKPDQLSNKAKVFEFQYYEYREPSFHLENIKDFNYFLFSPNNMQYNENFLNKLKNITVIYYDIFSNSYDSDRKQKFISSASIEYLKMLQKKEIKVKVAENEQVFKKLTNSLEIAFPYPSIGYEKNIVEDLSHKNNFKLKYIYDPFDLLCWPFANSGFFKFKKKIEIIINNLKNL